MQTASRQPCTGILKHLLSISFIFLFTFVQGQNTELQAKLNSDPIEKKGSIIACPGDSITIMLVNGPNQDSNIRNWSRNGLDLNNDEKHTWIISSLDLDSTGIYEVQYQKNGNAYVQYFYVGMHSQPNLSILVEQDLCEKPLSLSGLQLHPPKLSWKF